MIELLRAQDCIGCDKCVTACPTNVFDRLDGGNPVIARQSDCQTCFMCEAYCPTDALYLTPEVTPLPPDAAVPTEHIGPQPLSVGGIGCRSGPNSGSSNALCSTTGSGSRSRPAVLTSDQS